MKMAMATFIDADRRLKDRYPRAYPWIWFFGLYLAGMISLMIFAYGMRWLIKG